MIWFPDNPKLERLAGIIFDLRRELFQLNVYESAHEREWEDEEQEKRREKRNEQSLKLWDNETRKLILG